MRGVSEHFIGWIGCESIRVGVLEFGRGCHFGWIPFVLVATEIGLGLGAALKLN
jgi:hypothetical protein